MMVAVLVCLFAISIGAETITYEGKQIELVNNLGDPSWYAGNTALAIQDKDSIVILKDAEGNMTAYPSYYILKFGVDVKDGKVTNTYVLWADQNGVDYSFVNEKTGKNYSSGSIYYVEFPYGMTKCMNNSIFGKDADAKPESNVVEIVIPDSVTVIDAQAFRRMNSCKKVTMSKNVTNLVDWAFCGSPKLETVVFPEGCLLESIGNSFSSCTSLSSINLEACTKLKTLGSTFNGCTSLRKIALPDSIETIGDNAFYRIGQLTLASDYLPKNLKAINGHFLSGCTLTNTVLYFPEGFTSLTSSYNFNDDFKAEKMLTLVFLGKITEINLSNSVLTQFQGGVQLVFAKNTYSELAGDFVQGVDFNGNQGYISKHADGSAPYTAKTGTLIVNLQNNDPNSGSELGKDANGNTVCKAEGAPAKLIFCGGDTVEYSYSVRNNHTDKGWYRFHTTSWTYDLDAHKTANVHYNSIVYQAGNCGYDETTTTTCVICKLQSVITGALATGEHTYEDDFNCETALYCETCKKTLAEALTHDIKVTIVYEDGYNKAGLETTACENEGCAHGMSEKTEALFELLGYSTDKEGTRLVAGYKVNEDAYSAYVAQEGVSLSYGIVAYAPNEGETSCNPLAVENGAVSLVDKQYTIHSEINECYMFDFIITGFDATQSVTLAMCAYVFDGKEINYLCAEDGSLVQYESAQAVTVYNGTVVKA